MTDIVDRLRRVKARPNHAMCQEAAAEIERLRNECETWKENFTGAWRLAVEKDEEIERLRGLLREIGDLGWLQAPHPLTKRVRDALGE